MDPAMAEITIYNLPPSPPNWDEVGIFYVTFCATWTSLVLAGMVFCWLNRDTPAIRIRGIALSFSAIIFLHLYWILAQITYPIGATMPIVLAYDIQYFFMGIWFPLGVALFHASNLRFLHIAKLQKQFALPSQRAMFGCNGASGSILCRIRNMNYTVRVMMFIGAGMVLQVLLTVGMWLACKKYHPTFGIPGTEIRGDNVMEQLIDLGRGWEWWPSVLWQFIWTWIVAPILIWRAWGIRDTMGWRAQTVGCCIASLHATPMFLIASYVLAFEAVNPYFSPSQWIHFSIMIFEIFTVFVPVYEVFKHRGLSKKVAESNAKWDATSQTSTLRPSTSSDSKYGSASSMEKGQALDITDEEQTDRLLTISALEHVLNENPGPLQDFSALCDFSGENIAFLTRAAKWQAGWPEMLTDHARQAVYNRALEIYTDFISPRDAEFPLNLPSKELKELEEIFERPARIILGETKASVATPFDDEPRPATRGSNLKPGVEVLYTGAIPEVFSPIVFDKAIKHIKYLVLTNTWPKYVAEMQKRRGSAETERSGFSAASETTLASRVSSKMAVLVRNFL